MYGWYFKSTLFHVVVDNDGWVTRDHHTVNKSTDSQYTLSSSQGIIDKGKYYRLLTTGAMPSNSKPET